MSSGSASGYDRLAKPYALLERLAFGNLLMEARVALLDKLESPQRVLIVGEGDGRFLNALLLRYPNVQLDVIEQSSKMMARAKARLNSVVKITWIQQDVAEVDIALDTYDAVVTSFILDSFEGEALASLIPRLSATLRPGGQWYYVDFHLPASGWASWRARVWLFLLYTFFRLQTGLSVKQLEDPSPLFETLGLESTAEQYLSNGLLVARLYKKPAAELS